MAIVIDQQQKWLFLSQSTLHFIFFVCYAKKTVSAPKLVSGPAAMNNSACNTAKK